MPERRRLTRAAERVGLVLALLGVLAVAVWLISLAGENAKRASEEEARRVSQVEQCFAEAGAAPGLHDVLSAVEVITRNQLDHVPLGPRDVQQTKRALEALQSFHAEFAATTPTVAECRVLADRLNVEEPGADR